MPIVQVGGRADFALAARLEIAELPP